VRARALAAGVAAVLAFRVVFAAAPAPPLQALFIGNMAFAITDGKTTLYTDFPYQPGAFGYMSYDFAKVPKTPGALCLITHGHDDHFDPALFAKLDAKIIAPPKLAVTLPADRVIPFAPKMTYRDIVVEALKTPHASIDHDSYLITWRGLRLYFTGDTESTEQLRAAKNLDYAFVSPWLLASVAKQNARIDARHVVVYHHKTDETVPAIQDRIVPTQGQLIALRGRDAAVTSKAAPR
jgi:L-ascorbate metabolism protein UlaG (beta-lactamase superfamily)